MTHLVCEQRDDALGLPLQVQVHVEELPVKSLVNLLLPLHAAGLLHGALHAGPVEVTRQVTQENPHVLDVVQGDAELAESEEEQKRRKKRVEVEKRRKRSRATEKWKDGSVKD